MSRTDAKKRLATVLLIVNLAFIWGNSLMPADISQKISDAVKEVIAAILRLIGEDQPTDGGGLIRKLAHFTEFCILGVVLCRLLSLYGKPIALSLLFGFFAACIDETIQRFVPGRGPRFTDVMIDTGGVALGIGIFLLTVTLIRAGKNGKPE